MVLTKPNPPIHLPLLERKALYQAAAKNQLLRVKYEAG
jgi:hypothetical protein